jgi:ABC-2 type transport system ATP-binding protein
MTAAIEASHLHKTFGATLAVDDLCMHVEEGQIYGLVGSDGAGKTTTIRLLVGALRPDSGLASVCGFSLDTQIEGARAQLGYLSQRFSLYEDLTVLENIRFFAELRGLTRKDWRSRSLEILEFVGLSAFKDRLAGQLSGGMKQKLGLASALVTRPRLLLLDEPTTGVDPVTRQDFWQLLFRLVYSAPAGSSPGAEARQAGEAGPSAVTVLLTTPYMDEAARCQCVGFMRQGRLIAEGAPSELRSGLDGCIIELRGGSMPALREIAGKVDGVEDVRLFGDRLHLRVAAGRSDSVLSALEKVVPASPGSHVQMRVVPPTLEDVFISLSEGKD